MIAQFRTQLNQFLHLHESPHRTALAFALGVVIAFSPTYGLHTASVILCAWGFRLNFIAILSGSLINNPWTLVPILGLTFWTGFELTSYPPVSFTWDDMSLASFYTDILPYFLPFMIGGIVLSLVGGMLGYPIAYIVISRYRTLRRRQPSEREPLPPGTRLG